MGNVLGMSSWEEDLGQTPGHAEERTSLLGICAETATSYDPRQAEPVFPFGCSVSEHKDCTHSQNLVKPLLVYASSVFSMLQSFVHLFLTREGERFMRGSRFQTHTSPQQCFFFCLLLGLIMWTVKTEQSKHQFSL